MALLRMQLKKPQSNSWLLAGLGNPGPAYAGTRHNIGRDVIADLAASRGLSFKHHRAGAAVSSYQETNGTQVILAIPETFMNLSGQPIAQLLKFYKIPATQLIVVHDELDLSLGALKLKQGGGHGGHNGLRSIISHAGADFIRLRFGIGRPPDRQDPADYVLSRFASQEQDELGALRAIAAEMVEETVVSGVLAAQQKFHSK